MLTCVRPGTERFADVFSIRVSPMTCKNATHAVEVKIGVGVHLDKPRSLQMSVKELKERPHLEISDIEIVDLAAHHRSRIEMGDLVGPRRQEYTRHSRHCRAARPFVEDINDCDTGTLPAAYASS